MKRPRARIEKAISKSIRYLARIQNKNGGFSASALDGNGKSRGPCDTSFIASLILCCLSQTGSDSNAWTVSKKGIAFLLNEKNHEWSWNYWQRKSDNAKRKPYPDDLDDTFCALKAISIHNPEKITGEAWSAITKILTGNEAAEGGPYETWVVSSAQRAQWKDIDTGVNANIASFLALHSIRLPNLDGLIEKEMSEAAPKSLYYTSYFPLAYFASATCGGDARTKIIDRLFKLRKKNGTWGNLQDTALATTALLRLGANPEKIRAAIAALRDACEKEFFEAYPFYLQEKKPEPFYCGSPALTAALCIEALQEFSMRTEKIESEKAGRIARKEEENFRNAAIAAAEKKLSKTSPEMFRQGSDMIESIIKNDPQGQIILLPFHVPRSLTAKALKIDKATLTDLGAANLLGWIAYKIHDDLMDDEGDPALLPLANVCLREVTATYCRILPEKSLHLFDEIMNGMESANLWERRAARNAEKLPDYGDYSVLAQKSLGHGLAPAAVFILAGYDPHSCETKSLLSFFRHYLIARQMNDDAHDWLPDLERGFVNSAAAEIIREAGQPDAKNVPEDRKDRKKRETFQVIFWTKTLPKLLEVIEGNIGKARIALSSLKKQQVVSDTEYLTSILAPLQAAAEKARSQAALTADFLKHY